MIKTSPQNDYDFKLSIFMLTSYKILNYILFLIIIIQYKILKYIICLFTINCGYEIIKNLKYKIKILRKVQGIFFWTIKILRNFFVTNEKYNGKMMI